ncbi:hypothetical protein HID58_079839, partial [Brassica napus]
SGPHLPMILDANHIEAIVEIELPGDDETPETVRPGCFRAYKSHFKDGGLSCLRRLGWLLLRWRPISSSNSWIRGEEGLKFGLGELKQLFAIKRNSGFHGTMILAPRAGRSIIDGIPNRDDRWREKFFVFKINPASVGDFDFGRIPREWSDEIGEFCYSISFDPFGSAPITPELHGLISTQRRGNPQWLAFTVDRIRAAYALPPGKIELTLLVWLLLFDQGRVVVTKERGRRRRYPIILTSPQTLGPWTKLRKLGAGRLLGRSRRLSLLVLWLGRCRSPFLLVRAKGPLDDDVDSSTHRRRRRAIENINSVISNSPNSGLPLPLRASGEGTSRVDPSAHLPEASSWRFSSGKLAAAETEKVAVQNDLDLMKEKHRREIEGCDAAARKEHDLARHAVLAVVEDKLQKKKKEIAAEIRLQEVRARIETMSEYIEGGFELEEEFKRLKGQEISLDLDYGLASVSDPSLSRIELPEISGDSKHIYVFKMDYRRVWNRD